MAYDWNKLKQDSIIGFSYSSTEEDERLGLTNKVKDLVKASVLLRSSPDYADIEDNYEPIEISYTRPLIPKSIVSDLLDYLNKETISDFQYFVRYCHRNKFALETDLIIELYELYKSDANNLKWLSIVCEEFQIRMLYDYEHKSDQLKSNFLNAGLGFDKDLLLKSTQRTLWKAIEQSDESLYMETLKSFSQESGANQHKHLSIILDVWSRQFSDQAYLIGEVNRVIEFLNSGEFKEDNNQDLLFLELVHFGSLKKAMGDEHLSMVVQLEPVLKALIQNVYINNDGDHALWLLIIVLKNKILIEDSMLIGKLLFCLSAVQYKVLWTEVFKEELYKGNEYLIMELFLMAWQVLPLSLIRRIVPLLSSNHIYDREWRMMNRLSYGLAANESNEALEFLSSSNGRLLYQIQLMTNTSFDQVFAKRNSFLHLLNKYGHLPKD